MQVLRNGQVVDDSGLDTLTKVSPMNPAVLRGRMNRLVTDTIDAGSSSWRHLVELGDVVRIRHQPRYEDHEGNDVIGQEITREIMVARPSGEQDNDPQNQRKHDVRTVKLKITVFEDSNGGPSATLAEVQQDVLIANQRFAQAAIQVVATMIDMGPQGQGVAPPPELVDGIHTFGTIDEQTNLLDEFSPDELDVIEILDGDPTTIDVFYTENIHDPNDGGSPRAVGYACSGISAQAPGGVSGCSWIVMSESSELFTLGHEMMHVLLDSVHRPSELSVSLFAFPTSIANTVNATKRIGPFAGTEAAGIPGDNDTATMRDNAELLPQ